MIRRTKKGASMATGMLPQEIPVNVQLQLAKPQDQPKLSVIPTTILPF
jgi:hypothetical protein